MNNDFFIKIKKKAKLYKILSLISIILQFIFYIIQDLLDLYYTNEQEKKKRLFMSLLFIFINIILNVFVLFNIYKKFLYCLLFSIIIYFVFGFLIFFFIAIKKYTRIAVETRPIEYYSYHIDKIINIVFIISGILFLLNSLLIFLYYKKLKEYNKFMDIKRKKIFEEENAEFFNNDDDMNKKLYPNSSNSNDSIL